MTSKEILDSFSTTLMQDERILSTQERALLTTLLQHTKTNAGRCNRETQDAVRAVIAGAVGETVAHRAFSVLGENIVERILENNQPTTETDSAQRAESGSVESRAAQQQQPGTRRSYAGPGNPQPQPPGREPTPSPRPSPARTSATTSSPSFPEP